VESRTFKVTVLKIDSQIVKPFTTKETSEDTQPTMGNQLLSAIEEQYKQLRMMPTTSDKEISNACNP
jgi:hypothetical protein